jgi:hypothetical protein
MGSGTAELIALITTGADTVSPPDEVITFSFLASGIMILFLAALMTEIFWRIHTDKIKINRLISESNGSASFSRFQMLVFTFTIAMSFLIKVLQVPGNAFPIVTPGVISLLGISGATYVLAKKFQKDIKNELINDPDDRSKSDDSDKSVG